MKYVYMILKRDLKSLLSPSGKRTVKSRLAFYGGLVLGLALAVAARTHVVSPQYVDGELGPRYSEGVRAEPAALWFGANCGGPRALSAICASIPGMVPGRMVRED